MKFLISVNETNVSNGKMKIVFLIDKNKLIKYWKYWKINVMFKRFKKNSDHKSDVYRSMSNILQYLLSIYKKIKRNIYVQ